MPAALALAGVTMLVVSAIGIGAGPAVGSAYGLWELPSVLGVHFSRNSTIYGPASPGPFASLSYTGAFGVTFVEPLHEFVASAGGGPGPGVLYPVGEDQTPATPWRQECGNGIGTVYYPGAGSVLFSQCLTSPESSQLLEVSVSTLVPLANVTLPTGDAFEQCVADGATPILSCATYGNELWTIDVSRQQVVGAVHLPGAGREGPWISYDDEDSRLLAADPENNTLTVVDPSNSSIVGSVQVPGLVTSVTEDSQLGRLFVAYCGPSFCGYPSGVAELNASTLAPFGDVPTPFGGLYFSTVDAEHGEVDLSAGLDFLVLNESSNKLVSSTGGFPFSGYIAVDPARHLFAVADSSPSCSNVCVDFVSMSRNYTSQPPYSSFPVLGVAAPFELGAAGVLVGLGLLLVAWRIDVDQEREAAERAIALAHARAPPREAPEAQRPS